MFNHISFTRSILFYGIHVSDLASNKSINHLCDCMRIWIPKGPHADIHKTTIHIYIQPHLYFLNYLRFLPRILKGFESFVHEFNNDKQQLKIHIPEPYYEYLKVKKKIMKKDKRLNAMYLMLKWMIEDNIVIPYDIIDPEKPERSIDKYRYYSNPKDVNYLNNYIYMVNGVPYIYYGRSKQFLFFDKHCVPGYIIN